jgi:hypothetical protein
MKHDSQVSVAPGPTLVVSTPQGTVEVAMTRLHAQILACALSATAGPASKGIAMNAHTFRTAFGEAVVRAKAVSPIVRLDATRRGVVVRK